MTCWGQTVPSTGSSNREGLITDNGQPCTMNIQRQWGRGLKASLGLESPRRWICLISSGVGQNLAWIFWVFSAVFQNCSVYKNAIKLVKYIESYYQFAIFSAFVWKWAKCLLQGTLTPLGADPHYWFMLPACHGLPPSSLPPPFKSWIWRGSKIRYKLL